MMAETRRLGKLDVMLAARTFLKQSSVPMVASDDGLLRRIIWL
jgi:hypothetical protein